MNDELLDEICSDCEQAREIAEASMRGVIHARGIDKAIGFAIGGAAADTRSLYELEGVLWAIYRAGQLDGQVNHR